MVFSESKSLPSGTAIPEFRGTDYPDKKIETIETDPRYTGLASESSKYSPAMNAITLSFPLEPDTSPVW